ncbi:MAG: hypothetical protein IJO19_03390 [Clostridia bacterium]|nr:hypothetical protein [Clostridia bacterium]
MFINSRISEYIIRITTIPAIIITAIEITEKTTLFTISPVSPFILRLIESIMPLNSSVVSSSGTLMLLKNTNS